MLRRTVLPAPLVNEESIRRAPQSQAQMQKNSAREAMPDGRYHVGAPGAIKSEWVGVFVVIRTVIQKADSQGISTPSGDDLVKAMGMEGISKSQVWCGKDVTIASQRHARARLFRTAPSP